MPEAPRITADELKSRMQAGEDFVFVDTRNPQAWATSDVKARHAIRVSLDDFEQVLPRLPKSKPIVTYCT
ncbi:MAG TPA: rhodanese-like domain-containing protein [Terriglobales bacterium]|nr:rhodanese-like domain-containing protein [Terriglobales bacterium]